VRLLYQQAIKLGHAFPAFRRFFWRHSYQFLARRYPQAFWTFMNYGYDPEPGETPVVLDLGDEADRYCIEMYHHVAGASELKDRDVLEVGCGRGGGASYLMRYFKPTRLVGVDISEQAISFCRLRHPVAGLTFEVADAEALPFGEASFDVVVNIESSHCYGSTARFFGEVYRVLRPQGYFLFADFRYPGNIDRLRMELIEAGFVLKGEKNITNHVFQALERDHDRKQKMIREGIQPRLIDAFEQFAGLRGTRPHQNFGTGNWQYVRFVLQKG
jgi:ubiquinone/menaquinone biosynthesis C-methylase UbiE